MNPWIIVAFILALIGAYFGGERHGRGAGVDAQKVADQSQFDQINRDLEKQKATAASILAWGCVSEPSKTDSVGSVVETHCPPPAEPLALPPPRPYSFQTRLQQIFDKSLSTPMSSTTTTGSATTGVQ